MKHSHFLDKQSRFSIRKLSIGICSVAIGQFLLASPQLLTSAHATEDPPLSSEATASEDLSVTQADNSTNVQPATQLESASSPLTETNSENQEEVHRSEQESSNLALNRPSATSGSENTTNVHSNAFDGDSNTRYAGARMKNNNQPDAQHTPQWLQVDLGARASIDSIKVDFYRKVYATEYTVESSEDGESNWKNIATRTELQANATLQNPTDNIRFENAVEVDRFLRFTFKRLNHHAAGNSVSVKDIEVKGRLLEEIKVPIDPIAKLRDAELAIEGNRVVLTNIQEDDAYTYEIIGSANRYVVANDGQLANYRLNDQEITLLVAARNKKTSQLVVDSKINKKIQVAAKHNETITGTNQKPQLALDIQEFLAGEGVTALTANDKIYISDLYKAQADLFNEDLKNILGLELAYGTQADAKILFHLTDEYDLKDEGYLIRIGDKIEIFAHDAKAFNYAAVTLAQMLQKDRVLTNGVYRDYPNYAIRGMLLDVARIPMRMEFLQDVSKLFRWYKLNELHLHFNDNQWPNGSRANIPAWKITEAAHRLESKKFPSLNKRPFKHDRYEGEYDFYRDVYKNPAYSLEEFKRLQDLNNVAGVNILAEIDTPGHSAPYTLYALDNPDNIDYLGQPIHHPQDLEALAINEQTLPDQTARAKRFVRELISDYLDNDVFKYAHIHLGVDEYWQKQGNIESFRQYLNELNALAKSKGKTLRTWGALSQFGGTTPVDKDIIFDEWAQYESISEDRIKEGFRVVNVPQPFTYVTPGRNHKDIINEQHVFDHWDPTVFNLNYRNKKHAALHGEPLLLGAKGALWGDEHREGIEESDLYHRLEKSLAMIGFKTWNPYSKRSFIDYQKAIEDTKLTNNYMPLATNNEVLVHIDAKHTKDNIIHDLSTNGHQFTNEGNVEIVELENEKWFKFNGENYLASDIETIGLPYTLEMTIRPTDSNSGTLLFSKDGAIYLNKKGRNQADGSVVDGVMLNRYFYAQHIMPVLEANQEYKLTFAATRQVLVVYLNGQKVATLAHQNETDSSSKIDRNFRTSFNLPFKMIGHGFKGYIKDIKVYNRTSSDEEVPTDDLDKLNVALHKPVYSFRNNSLFYDQGIRPYNRFKVTDGDISASEGRWNSSNRDNDYFIVDLKENTAFSNIELIFDSNRFADSFKFSVSDDMENFTDIHHTTDNTLDKINLSLPNQNARYLKFTILKRKAGSNETAVKELRVYQPINNKQELRERFATKAADVSNTDWLILNNIVNNKYASAEMIEAALEVVDSLASLEVPEEPKPDTPKNPIPDTPEEPKPDTPKNPTPDTPKQPKPDTPKVPTPDTPKEPKPDTPKVPTPDTPKEPKPDTPKDPTLDTPEQPKQEEIKPQSAVPKVAPTAEEKPIFDLNGDDDQDGYTNLEELLANSDMYDATSIPQKEKPKTETPKETQSTTNKEATSSSTKEATLPQTGEKAEYALFSAAALAILASLGMVTAQRRED